MLASMIQHFKNNKINITQTIGFNKMGIFMKYKSFERKCVRNKISL